MIPPPTPVPHQTPSSESWDLPAPSPYSPSTATWTSLPTLTAVPSAFDSVSPSGKLPSQPGRLRAPETTPVCRRRRPASRRRRRPGPPARRPPPRPLRAARPPSRGRRRPGRPRSGSAGALRRAGSRPRRRSPSGSWSRRGRCRRAGPLTVARRVYARRSGKLGLADGSAAGGSGGRSVAGTSATGGRCVAGGSPATRRAVASSSAGRSRASCSRRSTRGG